MRISILLIATAAICLSHSLTAQQKTVKSAPQVVVPVANDDVWTRRVSRLISIADTTDLSNRKLRQEDKSVPLSEILCKMVAEGKVKAYTGYDSRFAQLLTKREISQLLTPAPDTLQIEDPVSGKMIRKIVKKDIHYEDIVKFRILEEWTYNKSTGNTAIQIIGIAPVRDVYGDNGDYRGHQSLFWLKYADVQSVLKKYEEQHPVKNISMAVWNDYLAETK